jgi:hypothetical protein
MIRPVIALPLVIVATAALAQGALAQGVPTIDYEASCNAAARATGERIESIDACRGSERNARAVLVEQWGNFLAADRASCYRLTTTGTPGTYTELLTCLEMKRDARALPDRGTVGLGGAALR